MSFRSFTTAERLSLTTPWVTPDDPERLLLQGFPSTAGQVRFIESAHTDLIAVLTDEERERLGLLTSGVGDKDARHDNLARVVWHTLLAHEHLHGDTPEGREASDVRALMFPDGLKIVKASYRESAGRAAARAALLTAERNQVLASIPVRGSNLLNLTFEWNQMGLEMGELQDQRVTPARSESERARRRGARDRWIRAIKSIMGALQFEAEESPEAGRILERIAGIQAEVRRRLLAGGNGAGGDADRDADTGDGDLDGPDDNLDGVPGEEPAVSATGAENR